MSQPALVQDTTELSDHELMLRLRAARGQAPPPEPEVANPFEVIGEVTGPFHVGEDVGAVDHSKLIGYSHPGKLVWVDDKGTEHDLGIANPPSVTVTGDGEYTTDRIFVNDSTSEPRFEMKIDAKRHSMDEVMGISYGLSTTNVLLPEDEGRPVVDVSARYEWKKPNDS